MLGLRGGLAGPVTTSVEVPSPYVASILSQNYFCRKSKQTKLIREKSDVLAISTFAKR